MGRVDHTIWRPDVSFVEYNLGVFKLKVNKFDSVSVYYKLLYKPFKRNCIKFLRKKEFHVA